LTRYGVPRHHTALCLLASPRLILFCPPARQHPCISKTGLRHAACLRAECAFAATAPSSRVVPDCLAAPYPSVPSCIKHQTIFNCLQCFLQTLHAPGASAHREFVSCAHDLRRCIPAIAADPGCLTGSPDAACHAACSPFTASPRLILLCRSTPTCAAYSAA
jgi:hypothetical protein